MPWHVVVEVSLFFLARNHLMVPGGRTVLIIFCVLRFGYFISASFYRSFLFCSLLSFSYSFRYVLFHYTWCRIAVFSDDSFLALFFLYSFFRSLVNGVVIIVVVVVYFAFACFYNALLLSFFFPLLFSTISHFFDESMNIISIIISIIIIFLTCKHYFSSIISPLL